jgi:hypothetical protein
MSETGAGSASPDPQPPPEADSTESGQAALVRELAEAQSLVSQHRDQLLRAAAELENIRRRAGRDVEQAHRYALEKIAQELLPVRDSLELAAASAATADAASLAAGQEAAGTGFREILDSRHRAGGRAFRPAEARGHCHAGCACCRTRLGAVGGAEGLRAQWSPAATGTRGRCASARIYLNRQAPAPT